MLRFAHHKYGTAKAPLCYTLSTKEVLYLSIGGVFPWILLWTFITFLREEP